MTSLITAAKKSIITTIVPVYFVYENEIPAFPFDLYHIKPLKKTLNKNSSYREN